MNHFTSPDFWQLFDELPEDTQALARKNYELLQADPHHPSLRTALATPGTDSYHRDARRALVTTIVNGVVRVAAIPLLVGFVLASIRESRRLRLVVFGSAIVLTVAHLLAPIIRAGPVMVIAWVNPLYFLPAAAAVLSATALSFMARDSSPGRKNDQWT